MAEARFERFEPFHQPVQLRHDAAIGQREVRIQKLIETYNVLKTDHFQNTRKSVDLTKSY